MDHLRRGLAVSVRRATCLCLAATFSIALTPSSANATQFHVQAETVGDFYQLLNANNEVLNRRQIHQYVGFGAYDLLSDGEHQLSIQTLMRFDADFGMASDEVDPQNNARTAHLTVQHAVFEGRDLFGVLDFKLGRQLLADPLDFMMLDGLSVRLSSPWHIGVELIAGMESQSARDPDVPLTASSLELDGVRFVEGSHENTDQVRVVLGAALVTTGLWNTRARVSYRRIFSGIEEGAPLGKVNQEKIGAALYQRLFDVLHINGALSYDLYTLQPDAIRAGVRVQALDSLGIEAEYVRLVPVFDADSIFNVFQAYPLNDINARVRWHLSEQAWAYAGGMVRLFGNEVQSQADAPPTYANEDETVMAYGVMAGYHHRFGMDGRVSGDFSYEDGYGGSRMLVDVGGRWGVVPGEIELDGRMTAVLFQDELQENLGAFSFGYQVGGRYLFEKRAGLQLMLEHNINRLQKHQLRVFVLADVNLWL
ncbi:MAG: hypothetical protein ACPGU1_07640 [Myxococcota bacterium]